MTQENRELGFSPLNPLRNFPTELLPIARGKWVITVELDIKPPEEWSKSAGGIIIPKEMDPVKHKWAFRCNEIISIGELVKEKMGEADGNFAPDLQTGMIVSVAQANEFFVFGQKFFCCFPQFITSVIKRPEQSWEHMTKVWVEKMAKDEAEGLPGNVRRIGK